MERKYAWIAKGGFAFFNEGGGEHDVDLMAFTYDEEAAYGNLERIVSGCRDHLSDLSSDEVSAILRFADAFLQDIAKDLKLRTPEGAPIGVEDVEWKCLNHIDFIHLVIRAIGHRQVLVGDEEHADVMPWELTPSKFCASFALRMACNASRDYLSWDEARGLREYYLSQAAISYGIMQSLLPDNENGIPGALRLTKNTSAARMSAKKRWDGDPKRAAMLEVEKEWREMSKRKTSYRGDAQFARDMMQKHGGMLSEGGIKNAISRWRNDT